MNRSQMSSIEFELDEMSSYVSKKENLHSLWHEMRSRNWEVLVYRSFITLMR